MKTRESKSIYTLVFFIKVIIFVLTVNIGMLFSITAAPVRSPSLCGPASLLIICQKYGVETSLEELTRLSGYKEKQGTTIYGLYKAARRKGLYAIGMKIGVDDLAKLKIPTIAHLWNNHFVVVEGTQTETLKITDPPNKPKSISKEQLKLFYSGFALLISFRNLLFKKSL